MKKGFFPQSSFKNEGGKTDTPQCGSCGWYKKCLHPKLKPTGKGRKKILLVGEAPGEEEDRLKKHFLGHAGKTLKRVLRKYGVDIDNDCWRTNAVICRRPKDEAPDDKVIGFCRPNLLKTIKKLKPNVIILLGKTAIKSLIPVISKSDCDIVDRWAGYYIPCRKPNAWIIATFHPSHVLKENNPVVTRIFQTHLKEAVKRSKKKPWEVVPDYKSQIEIIMNPAQAAKELKFIHSFGGPIAFDYEANCLKPYIPGAKIITCSVCCDDTYAIAYPWKNEAIEATSLLLKSSLPKIAANLKFENTWTNVILKHRVKNWLWDTMIAAHVLNNSSKITGLTFQSFALLGMENYESHIKPFLKQIGKNKLNRIHEIDLKDLLLYNGLDSLMEFQIAQIQMKQFRNRKEIK